MLKKERQKAVSSERSTASVTNGSSISADLYGRETRTVGSASSVGRSIEYRDGHRREMMNESGPYEKGQSLNQPMKSSDSIQQRRTSVEEVCFLIKLNLVNVCFKRRKVDFAFAHFSIYFLL